MMHELTIAESLLEIARDEMRKHGASRLLALHVRYGALSNLMPEALDFAFSALVAESGLAGARLIHEAEPLVLNCGHCRESYTPEGAAVYAACPHCGHEFFHQIASGREIYLERMEAEYNGNSSGPFLTGSQ